MQRADVAAQGVLQRCRAGFTGRAACGGLQAGLPDKRCWEVLCALMRARPCIRLRVRAMCAYDA